MKVKVSCLATSIPKVAALAALSLIPVSQEQITALSTVQAHLLNVYLASWNLFFHY